MPPSLPLPLRGSGEKKEEEADKVCPEVIYLPWLRKEGDLFFITFSLHLEKGWPVTQLD